jgi:peptidyl-prolyl cis-trans isomerase B (cyclophilin B)
MVQVTSRLVQATALGVWFAAAALWQQGAGCQPALTGIPLSPVNILWAIDDRLFCVCAFHDQHKEIEVRSLIANAIRSSNPLDRRAAALALGRLDRPEQGLETLLKDLEPTVRAEAANGIAQALAGADTQLWGTRLAADPRDITRGTGALMSALTSVITVLPVPGETPPDLRGEPDPAAAGAMLDALGRLPHDRLGTTSVTALFAHYLERQQASERLLGAVSGLEGLIRRNAGIRVEEQTRAALRQIVRFGDSMRMPVRGLTRSAPNLHQVHPVPKDVAARTRRLAMTVLQTVADTDRTTILAAARDDDWQVRRLATSMLRPGIPGTTNFDQSMTLMLEERLRDSMFQVRLEAVRISARIAPVSDDCASLLPFLTDTEPYVVMQMADELQDRCGASPAVVDTLAMVAGGLAGGGASMPWQVSVRALAALGRLAPPTARKLVREHGYNEHPLWQVRAEVAHIAGHLRERDVIVTLARDVEPNVRNAAIEELTKLGDERMFAAALDALDSPDHQLVRTAARALAGAHDQREATIHLFRALQRLTNEAKDTSREARIAIFDSLFLIAPPEFVTMAKPYLTDFDRTVADRALALCRRLHPDGVYKIEPSYRLPVQAQIYDVQVLPKQATIFMADGNRIELKLLVDEAPMTVARFAKLAREGYYDNLTFHRATPNFMVQGGSPGANDYSGDARYLRDELGRTPHLRGAVGIASAGRDAGNAQFFIDLVDLPRLDHEYTVFATVASDMGVVDRLMLGATIARITVQ